MIIKEKLLIECYTLEQIKRVLEVRNGKEACIIFALHKDVFERNLKKYNNAMVRFDKSKHGICHKDFFIEKIKEGYYVDYKFISFNEFANIFLYDEKNEIL